MAESNRASGGRFEQELSHILAENGFWVHVMQQNKAVQPADLIAVRGKFHTLIDCKVCENDVFPFERVESNQRMAMKMFSRKAGELCYFALKLSDGCIRLISLSRIDTLAGRGRKRLGKDDIRTETWNLEDWVDSSWVWAEDV